MIADGLYAILYIQVDDISNKSYVEELPSYLNIIFLKIGTKLTI